MNRGAILKFVFGLVWLMAVSSPAFAADGQANTNDPRMHQLYAQGGEKTCLQCHNSPPVNLILQTPMAVKGDLHSPFGQQGCETCHGPSADHAAGKMTPDGKLILPPILFKKPLIEGYDVSPVDKRNEVCLSCHQAGLRMNWQGSQMQKAGVACADCHTSHATRDPVLVKATQPDKCFACHAQQRAESFEYSHHPIREGKVVCSDCHNPHGSPAADHLLKEFTVNEVCYNCHADKRGPMLWEHQPVRDACTNCHTPHGSVQPRLLKEQLVFLCTSCHSQNGTSMTAAFGGAGSIPGHSNTNGLATSMLANQRACLNCHSQIHGSNSPAGGYFFR
ncbi:MAG: DmsE family decaheme c-type cytochrome [Bradyrhizobium sp.]